MRDKNTSAADNYRKLASYTGTPGGAQLFVMQKGKSMNNSTDSESEAKLVKVTSETKISSTKTNLQHALIANYIVKWILTGSLPEYTGCTLVGMYKCAGGTKDPYKFEIEGISMYSGQMYAAARIVDKNTDDLIKSRDNLFKAKLYKVAL